MKSIFLFICAILLTSMSFAQITEGSVTYKMDMSSDDPQMAGQMSMFQGSNMSMAFNKEFSRLELNMGMLMTMTTVVNNKKETGIMLMSGLLGKKAIKMTKKDIKASEVKDPKDLKVEVKPTDETKVILGYTCRKYVVSMDNDVEVNYWTTGDIVAPKNKNKYMITEVEGFPLEFETSTMGIKMSFTASDFKSSLKGMDTKTMFDMSIPEGYEETTMEQIEQMGM